MLEPHSPENEKGASSPDGKRVIRVALAGQPNVGKSTVFNLLTGLSQHVGNWPGKTIEKKTGYCKYNGYLLHIIDLPGTYSLTANSLEERIARNYIIKERPDVVVALVDAAILERSLYLLTELLLLQVPVVLGLNMVDVAEQRGYQIEPEVLQAALGIPVVPMVATRNQGIKELLEAIIAVVEGRFPYNPRRPEVRKDHRDVLVQLLEIIKDEIPEPYPGEWVALKLLEGDAEITKMVRERLDDHRWEEVHSLLKAHEDAILDVAGGRYEWIGRMMRAAVVKPRLGQIGLTERLDRVAAHPVWGLLVMAFILGGVFWLTYTIGSPLQEWLESYVVQTLADFVSGYLEAYGAPGWVQRAVVEGIIGGAGTVLTFLPILFIFFAALGFLEDVGYMARMAYVMDRFMHFIGLHGKSFLPLFLGFGCNVPGIMGARIIEDEKARLLTILLAPLVPCTARMAVLAFLAPVFFGPRAVMVSWGLVLLNLLVLAVLGKLLNLVLFHGEHMAFIMELPLYHIPNLRTIGITVWRRSLAFIKKAGTIILAVSVLVWVLASFPGGDVSHSVLAWVGQKLEPIGRFMGLDAYMMVALLTSFIAKENAVATLGVIYRAEEETLATVLQRMVPVEAGLAFMVMEMLFIPCVATMATIHQETGSWRWTAFSVGLLLVVSFLAGVIVYQCLSL
ncbi:MAG TPA: ferrous iron transport protein B [Chloroflexi bacterium]|nr:ferrous iron transport protein B [Chloroflexota bacterium]